jgi:hypothetical protein
MNDMKERAKAKAKGKAKAGGKQLTDAELDGVAGGSGNYDPDDNRPDPRLLRRSESDE